VGTEAGHAPDPTWSTGLQWGGGSSSTPTVSFREADTVLQKMQWFYKRGAALRSLPDLISSCETTAGHNSLTEKYRHDLKWAILSYRPSASARHVFYSKKLGISYYM
jgi:hypothetical protein